MADWLDYDDQLLTRINELMTGLPDLDFQNEVEKSRTQTLCARLAGFISDEIRCRLDRIYLEALASSHASDQIRNIENLAPEASLKTELETLYTEIGAVAQMCVEQAFTLPLVEKITKKKVLRRAQIALVLENVCFEE